MTSGQQGRQLPSTVRISVATQQDVMLDLRNGLRLRLRTSSLQLLMKDQRRPMIDPSEIAGARQQVRVFGVRSTFRQPARRTRRSRMPACLAPHSGGRMTGRR